MDIRNAGTGTLLLLLAAAAPAPGASLSFTSDPQPLPEASATGAAPLAIESWAAGSATLVPVMAADTPATAQNPVDAPATTQAVGKPVDDVSFVRRATESGRKEIAAARDAAVDRVGNLAREKENGLRLTYLDALTVRGRLEDAFRAELFYVRHMCS